MYAFGGMDDERQEQMTLWKWDLNADTGFAIVHYRQAPRETLLFCAFSSAAFLSCRQQP